MIEYAIVQNIKLKTLGKSVDDTKHESEQKYVKFALLITATPHPWFYSQEDFHLSKCTRVKVNGSFGSYFVDEKDTHWEKWLGEIDWERLEKSNFHILKYTPTSNPTILDGENNALVDDLFLKAWPSLMLSFPWRMIEDKPTIITGWGILQDDWIAIHGMKSITTLGNWVPSGFTNHMWDSYIRYVKKYGNRGIECWIKTYNNLLLIERNSGLNHILYMAIEIMRESFASAWPDIRFPNFIRSAECVLATPRNASSTVEFIRRSAYVIKNTENASEDKVQKLHKHLKLLYEVRNDSFHGKPFAHELKKRGPKDFEKHAPQLEFIAEWLNRKCIEFVISNPDVLTAAQDRDALEKYWENAVPILSREEAKKFLASL